MSKFRGALQPVATLVTLTVLIFISIVLYASTGNYGESALALAAGLLAVFSVQWDGEKAALFLFVWITFSLVSLLLYSVRSAAENESILLEAALAIDTNNVSTNVEELQKLVNGGKKSQLGPLERADVVRIFAYRKLPISHMKQGLIAVSTLYTISKGDYKTLDLFILDVYQMFGSQSADEEIFTHLLNRIYAIIRDTPVSPAEFIDAFNQSRRFALSSDTQSDNFFKRLSVGLSKGVSPSEMYYFLNSQAK